jgi:hypothetical protein
VRGGSCRNRTVIATVATGGGVKGSLFLRNGLLLLLLLLLWLLLLLLV